jgi:hypothetical protein
MVWLSDARILDVSSLALIGNARDKQSSEGKRSSRGVFDKETRARRKPLVPAADALSYGV